MSPTGQPDARALADSQAVAERYRASIYRYILRLVRNASLADDLTQETFLRVHQHLGELKDAAALEAWLYRIATNVSYDRLRRREPAGPALPVLNTEEGGSAPIVEDGALRPDQLLEQKEMGDCVMRFLTELPDGHRQVLLLHDLQGYTDPEIAQMLGLSLENVKIRLHRARTKLRTALAEGCRFSRDERGVFICEPGSPDHT